MMKIRIYKGRHSGLWIVDSGTWWTSCDTHEEAIAAADRLKWGITAGFNYEG